MKLEEGNKKALAVQQVSMPLLQQALPFLLRVGQQVFRLALQPLWQVHEAQPILVLVVAQPKLGLPQF